MTFRGRWGSPASGKLRGHREPYMTEQRRAIITTEPVRGICFGEDLDHHVSIFVPLNQVIDSRFLHVNDYITFDLIENPIRPGKMMATRVRYTGHALARQVSERGRS
jgi:hypothetical protein